MEVEVPVYAAKVALGLIMHQVRQQVRKHNSTMDRVCPHKTAKEQQQPKNADSKPSESIAEKIGS